MSAVDAINEANHYIEQVTEWLKVVSKNSTLAPYSKFCEALQQQSKTLESVSINLKDAVHQILANTEKVKTTIQKAIQSSEGLDDSYDTAIELCDEIEMLAGEVPEKGEEFARSVLERTAGIRATVEEKLFATDGQISALENMSAGLSRWIR